MSQPKKSIQEKAQKELPDFVAEVDGLSEESISARLVELAKGMEELQSAKEGDEELEQAREKASELAAPYREAKAVTQLKTRYLIQLLQEKGKV